MRLGFSREAPKNHTGARRYRTVAPTSQVDESLFGNKIMLDRRGKSNSSRESIVLSSSEWQPILSASKITAKVEMNAHQRKREEEYKAAESIRHRLIEVNNIRKQNMPPSQMEIQAQDRSKKTLERANTLIMMQEDEIKELNKVILATQCQEIREVQIMEKRRIQAELAEEEKLLNVTVEMERLKAIEAIEQADALHKQKLNRVMKHNLNQVSQNIHSNKQVQDEMKRQEEQTVQEREKKWKLEDLKALEQKREAQQHLHEERKHIKAMKMLAKTQRMEEEKLADIENAEFIQKKMKQEAEQKAAQKRKKKERELEHAKMFARQKEVRDNKAKQDEIHTKRIKEMEDIKWRRKEKDLAAKTVQEEAKMRTDRLEQSHSKQYYQSREVMLQKEEFERVLKASQYSLSKEKEEEEKKRKNAANYLEALQHQKKEQDHSAIANREKIMKEAHDLIEANKLKRVQVDETKQHKLKELKATGLSEKYCSVVERKVNNKKTLKDQRASDKTHSTEGTLLNTMGQMTQGGKGSERQYKKHLNLLAAEEVESERQDRQQNNIAIIQHQNDKEQHQKKERDHSAIANRERLPRQHQRQQAEAKKINQIQLTSRDDLVQKPFHLPPIHNAVEHPVRGRVSPIFCKQDHNKTGLGYEETRISDLRPTRFSTAPSLSKGRLTSAGQPNFRLPPIHR
ncbi:cilia- and flagella-associated protein 45-like [Labrus bergylta]|uniref:cilia- and flagella-associated protein 45-like n=1 Tax=Labrus bergylta TaxID=56723 RepID=UPI0033139C53